MDNKLREAFERMWAEMLAQTPAIFRGQMNSRKEAIFAMAAKHFAPLMREE